MHAYRPGDGPQRTRVLYLFRSPASLKVGRKPLDAEVVEALEHTHPDLSFDWTAIRREPRPEPKARRERGGRAAARRGAPRPVESARPRPATATEGDDQSVLGRAVGVAEAARLRGAYADLLQRIARRARTPDERDRLLERAQRLNPDDWRDEAAATGGVQSVEADWDAIAAELPRRRRGRRGGRHRERPDAPRPSGIMAEGADKDGESTDETLDDADRAADADGGDGGAVGGADADPGSTDVPDER